MKYLIVGLGNIGPEYAGTRHNIGFRILDAFAEASNISFSTERYGDVAHMRLKNKLLVLLKPSTYMNLSGNAVRYWKEKENIATDHILVLVDDIALPFGAIRIRPSGSDAGHNGRGAQIDYVLGHFTLDQRQMLPARVDVACEAIRTFCLAGINTAMNTYNNK